MCINNSRTSCMVFTHTFHLLILMCPCSLLNCKRFSVQRVDLVSLPLHQNPIYIGPVLDYTTVVCSIHKHRAGWMAGAVKVDRWTLMSRQCNSTGNYLRVIQACVCYSDTCCCLIFCRALLSLLIFGSGKLWSDKKTIGEKLQSRHIFKHRSITFRERAYIWRLLSLF